jgi:2-polyprenyl-6-methoxyphenol hydroxylase-like FAD-dependent oxidoreductase
LVASYRDVRLPRLDFGRVVYVGDSGHAMSPQLGQGSNLALLDALALAAALREEPDLTRALPAYSRARRSQLRYDQLVNRLLTPFFQGDSRLLGVLRDRLMPLAARLPLLRTTMVATMCGVKRGFVRRSLPIARAARQLPASTERASPR